MAPLCVCVFVCIMSKYACSWVSVHMCHGVRVCARDVSQSLRRQSSPSTLLETGTFVDCKWEWQPPRTLWSLPPLSAQDFWDQ